MDPFKNGILGGGRMHHADMRWWKHHHRVLTVRAAQALESTRARGICTENVKSFYDNLEQLHDLHAYPPERIWNFYESGS